MRAIHQQERDEKESTEHSIKTVEAHCAACGEHTMWTLNKDSHLAGLKAERARAAVLLDALEYISWPGPERDHWDRVNKAKEALAAYKGEE